MRTFLSSILVWFSLLITTFLFISFDDKERVESSDQQIRTYWHAAEFKLDANNMEGRLYEVQTVTSHGDQLVVVYRKK